MRHHRKLGVSALVVALAIAGCVRSPDGVDTSPEAAMRREAERNAVLSLEVINRSTYAMDLFVPHGSSNVRIGQARPFVTTHHTVPNDLVIGGNVRIIGITSPGGQLISSPTLTVRRGDTIVFEVSSDLRSSRAYVRN